MLEDDHGEFFEHFGKIPRIPHAQKAADVPACKVCPHDETRQLLKEEEWEKYKPHEADDIDLDALLCRAIHLRRRVDGL